MSELTQAIVFHGDDAVGNSTGVVVLDRDPADEEMQRVATRLSLADSAFVSRDHAAGWSVRSFSPVLELKLCVQALLATRVVLADSGRVAGDAPLPFSTRVGTIEVSLDAGGVAWARLDGVKLEGWLDPVDARDVADLPNGAMGRAAIVAFGRRRAYLEVDADAFHELEPEPRRVLAFLRARELDGLCLVGPRAPDHVHMRVFTTSLGGREASATGGAAAGLPAFLASVGEPPRGGGQPLVIEQGCGSPVTRGRLLARGGADGGPVSVGGRVTLLASGRLREDAWR
jgi:predicted PhzF superfamily epimerase YddE/YHI9